VTTLIVTPFTPRAGSGRGLRTVGVARALARSGDVEIRYVEFDGTEPDAALESEPHVSLAPLHPTRGLRRAVSYGRARAARVPRSLARGVSAELIAAGHGAHAYDRVVADGPTAAAALILVSGLEGVVYNAHNIESGLRLTLSSLRRDYGSPERLRAFERSLLTRAAETWLPTQRDVREAPALAPGGAFRYVPNVVDVSAIGAISHSRSNRVLFVADFSYEPNANAAQFLVDEVMPSLWLHAPAVELALVGRGLELARPADPRIHLRGFVQLLDEEYAGAACVVVPLLQSGGSPLKMIEAMAYGLPVIATSLAAGGLEEARAGVHFVEADGAGDLADALAAACRGESDGIGAAGRTLAKSAYSIEALARLIQ
jgi:glycosyltransferase involved in cell wall biosynthesis